jgi:hypothetical protein
MRTANDEKPIAPRRSVTVTRTATTTPTAISAWWGTP